MILYQPTESEIAQAWSRAMRNYPRLVKRLTKACDFLRDMAQMQYEPVTATWRVASQSADNVYVVGDGCQCDDYQLAQPSAANLCAGQRVCKHTLAIRMYEYIIRCRMRRAIDDGSVYANSSGHMGRTLYYRVGWGFGHYVHMTREGDPVTGEVWGPWEFERARELVKAAGYFGQADRLPVLSGTGAVAMVLR